MDDVVYTMWQGLNRKRINKMNCPVCGSKMEEDRDTLDGWLLMEESANCPKGCYSYSYVTGATEYQVGQSTKPFGYDYNTTHKEVKRVEKKVNRAIAFARWKQRIVKWWRGSNNG